MSSFTYLGIGEGDLKQKGALYTAREIANQPQLWSSTYEYIQQNQKSLQKFLQSCFEQEELRIILTGAGTSAFIGEVLEGPFQQNVGIVTRAVATTDLVTHGEQFLSANKPNLIISFARSGNSPESVAAVKLADKICANVSHLIITCNPKGALAQNQHQSNNYVFLLPPEADDQSLAMTGSFTSMLLTGLLLSLIDKLGEQLDKINQLKNSANIIFSEYLSDLKQMAELPFTRSVFLGSGPLKGIAHESHLKVQELSDGNVICKHDSYLGFRHGPKSIINSSTLIVFIFSNDKYVRKYEYDLVKDIDKGEKGIARIGIGENIDERLNLTLNITLNEVESGIHEEFLSIVSVLPAQILGFFKSMNLGLHPDMPSSSGTITRVVQGVNIYPYTKVPELTY
jgi:tagatose-6-phosphate ketose/aldose isomerase